MDTSIDLTKIDSTIPDMYKVLQYIKRELADWYKYETDQIEVQLIIEADGNFAFNAKMLIDSKVIGWRHSFVMEAASNYAGNLGMIDVLISEACKEIDLALGRR